MASRTMALQLGLLPPLPPTPAPLTEAVLLANVAYRGARGKTLRWDAPRMALSGDGASMAQELLEAPMRDGWEC